MARYEAIGPRGSGRYLVRQDGRVVGAVERVRSDVWVAVDRGGSEELARSRSLAAAWIERGGRVAPSVRTSGRAAG